MNLKTNEIQAVEGVAEATARSGLTRNQKVGIIIAASVLSAGVAYGVYRLVKFLQARHSANANETPAETPVQE